MRIELVIPPCKGGAKSGKGDSDPDRLKRQILKTKSTNLQRMQIL